MRSMKVTAVAVVAAVTGIAQGGNILLLTDSVGTQGTLKSDLETVLGMTGTVTEAQNLVGVTLSNYSQVWDLRAGTVLSAGEQNSYLAYLAGGGPGGGGGRLMLAGEWNSGLPFLINDQRNQSITGLVSALGGGSVPLLASGGNQVGAGPYPTQSVTGDWMNLGFGARNVQFSNSEFATSAGNGFFITTNAQGNGSVLGWDFGQMANAQDARMITYFDTNLRSGTLANPQGFPDMNDAAWIEDLWTFLDGSPQVVPLPSAAGLGLVGLTFLGARRRR